MTLALSVGKPGEAVFTQVGVFPPQVQMASLVPSWGHSELCEFRAFRLEFLALLMGQELSLGKWHTWEGVVGNSE